jgi:hypothetical protein
MQNKNKRISILFSAAVAFSLPIVASSHREAPAITEIPKLDCTDFYIFNSYEAGREDYVTIVANYIPLQDSYGGPNYFSLGEKAIYEIHVDNDGDAVEDLTFQFRFQNKLRDIALPIGPEGNQRTNAVPVLAVGPITAGNNGALNLDQTYTVDVIRGPRRTGTKSGVANAANNSAVFTKPLDNVGTKTLPDYNAYANQYIYDIDLPDSDVNGRVFVGQRKDPFVVNLGETFDLVNISTSPLGPEDANKDSLAYKNVTSLIIEVPKAFLLSSPEKTVIGSWSTASTVETNELPKQVSRLSHPLVNEVVIGLKDKDKFNASEPKDDGQFADYVTHPTLPAILELLYGAAGVKAPTKFPREDLVAVFLTGVAGLNTNGSVAEMMRLNTAIAAKSAEQQKNKGVIEGDTAGFPNGRRPGDDVVDIALRAVMGVLLPEADAPSGKLAFTDGATVNARMFLPRFPYLNSPLPGSPNDPTVIVTLQAATTVDGTFRSVPATFDQTTQSLQTAKPSPEMGYFRTKSDSTLNPTGVSAGPDENTVRVKITR